MLRILRRSEAYNENCLRHTRAYIDLDTHIVRIVARVVGKRGSHFSRAMTCTAWDIILAKCEDDVSEPSAVFVVVDGITHRVPLDLALEIADLVVESEKAA